MPTNKPAIVVSTLALLMVASAPAAFGEPNQATKDRCTQYAQRAVAQYQLMSSHPQCKVNDDLRWQNNLDNHYNACTKLPEFITKSEEGARDSHLQACGGLAAGATGTSAVGGTPAVAGTAAGAGTPAGAENSALSGIPGMAMSPASGTSDTGSASGSTATASGVAAVASPEGNCPVNSPSALPATATPVGIGASVKGGTLSFQSYQQKGKVMTYKVVRPAYILAQMHCTGRVENLYGPWISVAGSQGPEIFYVNLGNTVSGAPLSAISAAQLMQP